MATQLTEKRIGEMALTILIHRMAAENIIPSEEQLKRSTPNDSKRWGVTEVEAEAFMRHILPEVIRTRLGCTGVTLHWENAQ